MKGTKRLAVLAMFTAIALTIFVAEAQIPPIVPIPGVKLGLANIVTLIAMALLGRRQAADYKGWKVPEILLSGNEAKIRQWEFVIKEKSFWQ